MRTLFHILTRADWEKAQAEGTYKPDSLSKEGFIHTSFARQVQKTSLRFYSKVSDLKLLEIDRDKIRPEIKIEAADGDKFPHIFGPLNLDAVLKVHEFNGATGDLPKDFELKHEALIRAARPGDEAGIANVHTAAWMQSYRGQIPDGYLDSLPLSFQRKLGWWRDVVNRKTTTSVLVAEHHAHGIVGFCAVEPGRDDDMKTWGEIAAIYALNEFKGKGVGAALFRAGRNHLKAQGFNKMYLWVLSENPTVDFYTKMGGQKTAHSKSPEIAGTPLHHIRIEWPAI